MTSVHDIRSVTVLPGKTRDGQPENFREITIRPGDTLSIVGPTGSGKTAFINDLEVFAQGDTVTKRRILVNGGIPDDRLIRDPSQKPVAMITQNTKCLADLTVRSFLEMHIRSRKISRSGVPEETVGLANRFTGEKIKPDSKMSSLSGGQTRSLFIADAVIVSDTPILLLDEIENAGIFKEEVIAALKSLGKATIFVTHDPYVALLTDRRIVMKNGAVQSILTPGERERETLSRVSDIDREISSLRERIRDGDLISQTG